MGEFHVYPYKTLKLRISPSKFYNNIFTLSKTLKLRIYPIHLIITYLSSQISINYIFTQFFITSLNRASQVLPHVQALSAVILFFIIEVVRSLEEKRAQLVEAKCSVEKLKTTSSLRTLN